jgi:hypothetical protein
MPTFRPNEFFWANHCKEGESRWRAYARAIREIIHEGGGIPYAEEDTWIEKKFEYKELLWPKKDKSVTDHSKKK